MSDHPDESDAAAAASLADQLRTQVGRLKRRLRQQAEMADLTWSQLSVVHRLDREGPATVSGLARAEGMRPQSMGATMAALEAAGLVAGTPDPQDGRQTLWALTEPCRRMVQAGRAARQDWLCRTIQARLTPAERQELTRAVVLLRRLADS